MTKWLDSWKLAQQKKRDEQLRMEEQRRAMAETKTNEKSMRKWFQMKQRTKINLSKMRNALKLKISQTAEEVALAAEVSESGVQSNIDPVNNSDSCIGLQTDSDD